MRSLFLARPGTISGYIDCSRDAVGEAIAWPGRCSGALPAMLRGIIIVRRALRLFSINLSTHCLYILIFPEYLTISSFYSHNLSFSPLCSFVLLRRSLFPHGNACSREIKKPLLLGAILHPGSLQFPKSPVDPLLLFSSYLLQCFKVFPFRRIDRKYTHE